jgi:hypothetical protein
LGRPGRRRRPQLRRHVARESGQQKTFSELNQALTKKLGASVFGRIPASSVSGISVDA